MNDTIPRKRLTREASQALTRSRLLDTAQRLFVAHGYAGTSIRDIADIAGYSQGAFYSNFASKEEVLLELLRGHMANEAVLLSTLVNDSGGAAEPLWRALTAWADTLNQDADWCLLSIELQLHANRNAAFATEYHVVWRAHQAALGSVIGQLFAIAGRVPPVDTLQLAAALMAMAHGFALQRPQNQADTSGQLMLVFLRGVIDSTAPAAPTQ